MQNKINKVALVSGGGRGIGLAITKRLLADGFSVAVLGRRTPDQMQAVLTELTQSGPVLYCQGDLASPADRIRYIDQTLQTWGRLDCLVNNAGVAPLVRADVLEMDMASYDRVMDINLKGPLFLSQLVARHLLAQPADQTGRRGSIIFVGSVSADTVSVERAEYCLSKAGISLLNKILAARLAADGIQVFEVRPGIIKTDMTAKVEAKYDKLIEEGIFPMQRWGYPDDVAAAVGLLASGGLTYATGETLHIDGGFHIRQL